MPGKPDKRSSVPRVTRGSHTRMLRIIGGAWRGRTWRFPEGDIRPTPDRVRETLFNWLAPTALIYADGPARAGLPALPQGWNAVKSGRAGEVGYHLLRRTF